MYRVTVDSTDLYHLIPNDDENAKGYKRFADVHFFKAIQALESPTELAVDLLTPIQKFKREMDFHYYYLAAAREMREALLAKSSDCGSANYGDSETDQEKHLKQAKQIFGSVNNIQISEALKSQFSYDIDRKKIMVDGDSIKELGTYSAEVVLHKDIKASINFEVFAE